MIHVRRMLLLTLVVAGCDKTSPSNPAATPVNVSTAPTSTQPPVSASAVADPTENVNSRPEKQPQPVAAHEFGSPMAKAHPEQAKAILAAAEKAWEANQASYEVGTQTLANVHHWSRQLLLAQRALADTNEEDLAALVAYWKRSKSIYLKVRALYTTGTKGGETEKFAEATFYLAEAELWLIDAGGEVPDEID